MKKLLFLILAAVLLYGAFLFVPVGIFLFQASSLEFSDNVLYDQLTALTSVTIIEDASETDPDPQVITVTLTEEDLEYVLTGAFRRKENICLQVNLVQIEISPDMVLLEISYQYGWGKYGSFEITIFSQWLVDLFSPQTATDTSNRIGIMPVDLHTNRLYSVNLAEVWRYVFNITRGHAWLMFPETHQFQFEDLSLQEHELAVSLVW